MTCLLAIAGAGATAAAAAVTPAGSVVMSGLDNPRGLAVARPILQGFPSSDWALYVAEAGRGGGPGPHCIALPRGVTACPGATGAVTRLFRGAQQRVVTGLSSYAFPDGSNATGPHDVTVPLLGPSYVSVGLGGHPDLRALLGQDLGWIARFSSDGTWDREIDIATYDAAHNPNGEPTNSNPYGLQSDGRTTFVTDAGGNALYRVDRHQISTVAAFPSRAQGRPTDSVPTGIARGQDGALYVGELTGVPFAAGAARIYRVVPGSAPEVIATGFTTILDLELDAAGNLYVLEHSSGPVFFGGTGTLWKLSPNGVRVPLVQGLERPSSVAIGPDGAAYISNRGNQAGVGEVLRFDIGASLGLFGLGSR